MNSGRETTSFRYLVVGEGNILLCADDTEQLERYIQEKPSKGIAIYQRRFVPESALMGVEYEDELYLRSDNPTTEKEQ